MPRKRSLLPIVLSFLPRIRAHFLIQQSETITIIMKIALVASLVASAAAFAPVSQKSASTSLKAFEVRFSFETITTGVKSTPNGLTLDSFPLSLQDELGAQPPLGFFDPLGLVADGDQAKFDRLRAVEIKHGRICQLGVVGYLVTYAGIRLPGDISFDGTKFSDIPAGWDGSFAVPIAGALQVLAFCGLLELAGWKQDESSFPGDFSASPFPVGFLGNPSEEEKLELRAKELNQGRAAQMGMLALMVHDKLGNVDDLLAWVPKV